MSKDSAEGKAQETRVIDCTDLRVVDAEAAASIDRDWLSGHLQHLTDLERRRLAEVISAAGNTSDALVDTLLTSVREKGRPTVQRIIEALHKGSDGNIRRVLNFLGSELEYEADCVIGD